MSRVLTAGAAVADISPKDSQFLYGYPHVERYSTGIHDPLLSSALYLNDGRTAVLIVANDILWFDKATTQRVRERLSQATGVRPADIMLTATHTHSGPITIDCLIAQADPIIPKRDPKYLRLMEDGMVEAGTRAWRLARPAEIGLAVADGTGVGTNRRDPAGPRDPQVPVLIVQPAQGQGRGKGARPIALMVAYSMHPTVLHEDSTLVSGDFPGMTRQFLQRELLGADCPVLYHTGPAGNQSPRHVTKGNTFAEAVRLGEMLGRAIAKVIPQIRCTAEVELRTAQALLDLPRRKFPSVADAEARLKQVVAKLDHLRRSGAPRQEVRTAECDWFGAEETFALAKAAADGRLDASYRSCLPAEVQLIRIGPWSFFGWQGEVFVEYGLAVKARCPDSFLITCANGDLQGYIVTEEAFAEGGYEAWNSYFAPAAGKKMVEESVRLYAATGK